MVRLGLVWWWLLLMLLVVRERRERAPRASQWPLLRVGGLLVIRLVVMIAARSECRERSERHERSECRERSERHELA